MRIASSLSTVRASRALNLFMLPALVACATFLGACGDGNSSSGGSGGSGSGGTSASGGDTLKLAQVNNFTAMSTLTIPAITAAAGTDIKLSWDMVSKDIQGHAITANDINQVSFIPVKGSQAQATDWLNTGALTSDKIAGSSGAFTLFPPAGKTSAMLSEIPSTGGSSHLDPSSIFKVDDTVSYLVVFASGTQLGVGARTMLFLVPSTSETKQSVAAQADSTNLLSYTADLHDLTKLQISAAKPPVIDWSGVTLNGQKLAIGKADISSILIGFYEGKTVTDLETGFLNLEQATAAEGGPTQSWKVSVPNGQTAGLAGAKGRASEAPFASFTPTDGTWLLGLFCDDCQNPAPEIVTILDPQ